MPPKRLSVSLNPLWYHYVAVATLGLAVLLGIFRYYIIDRLDPIHCNSLLTTGRWLDNAFKNWQPDGCMMYNYQQKDITTCMGPKSIVFIGDSVTRQLFFQTAHIVDPALPSAPPDDEHKHSDHTLNTKSGAKITFHWDPFLNTSATQKYIRPTSLSRQAEEERPALLVLGSGLWYLRYADSGGLPAWELKIESTLNALSDPKYKPADTIVFLPVEDVVPGKLSADRAQSMRSSDIDAMNSDLLHRIRPPHVNDPFAFFSSPSSSPIALPLVFNKMLDPSQTDDGLHFFDTVVKMQANILLNLRCNDALPKTFPLDKTCCRSYPWPSPVHFLVLAGVILWGPVTWFLSRRLGGNVNVWVSEEQIPALVISGSIALIYLADRTGFWLKEQKQFSPWSFGILSFLCLAAGLLTVKRADNDLGILNRDQTDEWKGWMQIAILIYHYFGASKISGIYNPIRILVASYLFMTGYGHTSFYLKKADFGLLRVAQIVVRINFYTLLLAYTMNTDYISYYFSPLVTMWFLIIYATMFAGSQYNDRAVFLVGKIFLSMGLVTWFMSQPWLLETLFKFLEHLCDIRWSAREWAFRVNLDLWIPYVGMLAAIAVIKVRELRLTDIPQWPLIARSAIGVSAIIILWYFAFELSQPDKFVYNTWHPYISFLPVGAFVILRNANGVLRSASSRAFAFIGRCSLETFIIQYHLWLAGDTKGILLIIPGTRWRPLNMVLTTVIFIYISHRVSEVTGDITKWICGGSKKPTTLPTSNPNTIPATSRPSPSGSSSSQNVGGEVIFMAPEDGDSSSRKGETALPPEPDTPARPIRSWADRLAEGSTPSSSASPGFRVWYGEREWNPGVGTKLLIAGAVMWLLNVLWPYP